MQEKLIGPPMRKSDWGTGFIPKHLVSVARGIADLIDSVSIRHISGGNSDLQFKSYAAGRESGKVLAWRFAGWMKKVQPIFTSKPSRARTKLAASSIRHFGWSEVVRRFLTGET